MNCYIMRHGTTVWNENGIIQGRSKNRLSKAGVKLVEASALEHKYVSFDAIFCSPLMRAVQTANIMNRYHSVSLFKNEMLTEIDQGLFTGKSVSQLTGYQKQKQRERSKEFGMESYDEAFERANNFANYLKGLNFNNILIVTHNCIASFLYDILANKSFKFNDFYCCKNFGNAEIKMIEL